MTVPGRMANWLFRYCSMLTVQCSKISRYVYRRAEVEADVRWTDEESWVDEGVRYSNATTRAQGLDPM